MDEFYRAGPAGFLGNTLKISKFENTLKMAVDAGCGDVTHAEADFILNGLRNGFDLGVDHSKLEGRRVFKNYKSADEHKDKVHDALAARVAAGKTRRLGAWDGCKATMPCDGCVVPQGAVPKKLEPDKARPFSDHTATYFNSAVDMDHLRHTLDTYSEIASELKEDYCMRVEDVDGAFPILLLSPTVWRYMLVWWYDVDRPLSEQTSYNTLYMHTYADFGTAPLPGIWNIFFRCVKAMARYDKILTLPMPHYVDDNSIIGPCEAKVNEQGEILSDYLEFELGIRFKRIKSRPAATVQLVLGFWWDSRARTRCLEDEKLAVYLDNARDAAASRTVSLSYLRVLSGRLQRALMTMPPSAACLLTSIFALMRGLKLPWHRRRLTSAARKDLRTVISILESNHGRGYFSYDHMEYAPDVYTDASKERKFAGGGFVSDDGFYDFWTYGASARRNHIAYLEGDAVVRAVRQLGDRLQGKKLRIYIDNQSFCFSLRKGRSNSDKLNHLVRELFELSAQYDCVFEPHWISTHDNVLADALSRDKFDEFKGLWRRARAGVRLKRCG